MSSPCGGIIMEKDVAPPGPDQSGASPKEPVAEERREALRRIARFGTYTAPAMLVMLTSEKALAQSDLT